MSIVYIELGTEDLDLLGTENPDEVEPALEMLAEVCLSGIIDPWLDDLNGENGKDGDPRT